MGVGGSFDIIAGITKRAPIWMQKTGMEWLYRFLQEPGRMWNRYLLGNIKFVLVELHEKWERTIRSRKKSMNITHTNQY